MVASSRAAAALVCGLGLATSLLVGCASNGAAQSNAKSAQRSGPRTLNDVELLRTLRGRTLEGAQSDRSYVRAYCDRNGQVSALVDGADGRKHWSGGTWEVRQDAICFRWRNSDWSSGCARVALTANGAFSVTPINGGPSMSGAKVLDGNPYGLGF
jgi:hypothetical protein